MRTSARMSAAPVILSNQKHEAGKYPVEENRNGTTRPPFVRVETHPDHVAEDHGAKIQGSEDQETYPQTASRDDEIPAAPSEIEADLAVQEYDEDLGSEEWAVGYEPRVPFLHWRQEGEIEQCNQQLAQDAETKQREQKPQPRGVSFFLAEHVGVSRSRYFGSPLSTQRHVYIASANIVR